MPQKLKRGKPLTEMVKGSLDYTRHLISKAFYQTFERNEEWFWVKEVFATYLIVSHDDLAVDEYYQVAYTREGETATFSPRNEWLVVELAYQPQTMVETKRSTGKSLNERHTFALQLTEASAQKTNPNGPWPVRAVGTTADEINGNGRRYAAYVAEAAVHRAQQRFNENVGQGRLVLAGEVDHPLDKGNRTPLMQETVFNWTNIQFDGQHVLLEGLLLGTRKGKDLYAQMEGGIRPDISQRGFGKSVFIKEGDQEIEEVVYLEIRGYDAVDNGSDTAAYVEIAESQHQPKPRLNTQTEENTMDPITLEQLRSDYPDLVAQIEAEHDESRRQILESQLEARRAEDERVQQQVLAHQNALRQQLGIGQDDDLLEALTQRQTLLESLQERDQAQETELQGYREAQQQRQVAEHIETQVAALNYPPEMKAILLESVQSIGPATTEDADRLLETKRSEYDALMAQQTLVRKGFGDVEVKGPVFEAETGQSAFTQPAFEITEHLVNRRLGKRRDLAKATSPNEIFTRLYLEAFDRAYRTQLIEEAKKLEQFLEAETTTDLNLPYSVSRAMIEEVLPELVALSIFDFGLEEHSPTLLYFESYIAEVGAKPDVVNDTFNSAHDTWVVLNNKRIQTSTVVVTSDPAGTTYTEYTDFVVDYANGQIKVLSSGSMADATGFLISYSYDKVRSGENQPIQRGKGQLLNKTITLAADRLATHITDEAITFSRTQLGWDATTRTLNMLIRQIRQMIDEGIIRLAVASAISAANSGGIWDQTGGESEALLVKKMGLAKTAVIMKNYEPTFFLMSPTNAEYLSNWDGFKRDGFPDAGLGAGFTRMMVKDLPVFKSKHMPDSVILTGHRELVQYRVLSSKPMQLFGPFQARSGGNLTAGKEYYIEEYNGTYSLIEDKGGNVKVS